MAEHICRYIRELNTTKNFQISLKHEINTWFLSHSSVASEIDVKGGEAETVGEELSRLKLNVSYCPFLWKTSEKLNAGVFCIPPKI